MPDPTSPAGRPVSLNDLVILNDELAALVRAGIPLEVGLGGLRSTMPGRLRAMTDRLAGHLEQGRSLPEALAAEEHHIPRIYRAVVEAGLKAGRLPEALEALGRSSQTLADIRQRMALALLYPMAVVVVSYALVVGVFGWFVGEFAKTYESFQLPETTTLRVLLAVRDSVVYWGPGIPLFLIFLTAWGAISNRTAFSKSGMLVLATPLGWLPGIGRIVNKFHYALFSELCAVLISHRVSLEESLRLAAEATGDGRLIAGTNEIITDLKAGLPLGDSLQRRRVFPPFVQWMLSTGERQGALEPSLRQLADVYRRRAIAQADWFKLVVPMLIVLVVGGGVTLLYALALFVPVTQLMKEMVVG